MLNTKQDKGRETLSMAKRISDVLGNRADAETKHIVDAWLSESEQHRELFDKICSEQTMREKIHNYKDSDAAKAFDAFLEKRKQLSKKRTLFRILSGAAVIIICFCSWGLIRLLDKKTGMEQQTITMTKQENLAMTEKKPRLTLGDGTQIQLWGNDLKFKETEKGQLIMSGDSLLSQKEDSAATTSYNVLEVPPMCDFKFTLSDGTKVWMNAASTLKYPTKFASDSRTVLISGEVYLEVTKDAKRPFYVILNGVEIKVLGTSFNVRSYPNEQGTAVTLAEGKISAKVKGNLYTLTPGKQLEWEKTFGGISINEVDVNQVLSWTKGYYVFKNSRLADVTSTLQHWYGVSIMMNSEVSANTTYTGVVNKEEELEVFLQRLEQVSNVTYSRNGNYVTIY